MSDNLPETTSASIVPVSGDNLEVSASTPQEMVQCHNAMIAWCRNKIELVKNEAKELEDAYEYAKAHKWRNDTLKRHAGLAAKRVVFYQKFLAALEAGYCVVPNFPVTLFAIRTDAKKPKSEYALLRGAYEKNFNQDAKLLPQGEGEYKNPAPNLVQGPIEKVQQDQYIVEKRPYWTNDWKDLEFPANMARLHVMAATTRAMALKVFDEIGMFPDDGSGANRGWTGSKTPDPVLIGRIIKPAHLSYDRKVTSFMIAWHIDSRNL